MRPTLATDILTHAQTGRSLALDALAGAGTSFLQFKIAQALNRQKKRGLYLISKRAYKQKAQEEFRGLDVAVKTPYSLARTWASHGGQHAGVEVAPLIDTLGKSILNFQALAPYVSDISFRQKKSQRNLLDWIEAYQRSDRKELDTDTCPAGCDAETELLPRAKQVWADMIDPKKPTPIQYDTPIKLWALSQPTFEGYDYIMLDQAQDSTEAVIAVLLDQVRQGIQVLFFGDRFQQINFWQGVTNVMSSISNVDRFTLTTPRRFGAKIASVCNAILQGPTESIYTITGSHDDEKVLTKLNNERFNVVLHKTNYEILRTSELPRSKLRSIKGIRPRTDSSNQE